MRATRRSRAGRAYPGHGGSESVLLLSGGLDSTALAAVEQPALCLAIDYGQRPAQAEIRAARMISCTLGLDFESLRLDLGGIGGGLLKNENVFPGAPSPEWWPYRNQILVTAAASVALARGLGRVIVGTVSGDGRRHADGTVEFYSQLDALLTLQEGAIRVHAPAIGETSAELVRRSALGSDILAWTVSCHRAEFPCGACPGCWKRSKVLADLGILQVSPG